MPKILRCWGDPTISTHLLNLWLDVLYTTGHPLVSTLHLYSSACMPAYGCCRSWACTGKWWRMCPSRGAAKDTPHICQLLLSFLRPLCSYKTLKHIKRSRIHFLIYYLISAIKIMILIIISPFLLHSKIPRLFNILLTTWILDIVIKGKASTFQVNRAKGNRGRADILKCSSRGTRKNKKK